jgi:hypothetical protein
MKKNRYALLWTSFGYVLTNGKSRCGYFKNKFEVQKFLFLIRKELGDDKMKVLSIINNK